VSALGLSDEDSRQVAERERRTKKKKENRKKREGEGKEKENEKEIEMKETPRKGEKKMGPRPSRSNQDHSQSPFDRKLHSSLRYSTTSPA